MREEVHVTVYVSLPQLPLALRYEEPFDVVVEHLRELLQNAEARRYDCGEGQAVVVSFGVVAAVTVTEGHRTFELTELNRAIDTSTTAE